MARIQPLCGSIDWQIIWTQNQQAYCTPWLYLAVGCVISSGVRACSWTDLTLRFLQDGVRETGVSVAFTVRAMDAGPVLAQERVNVDADVQAPELLRDLFTRGTRCGMLCPP